MTSIFEKPAEQKPKSRPRLKTVSDLERFMRKVLRETYSGELPVARGKALSAMLDCARRLIESGSMEKKLSEVEKRLGGRAGDEELVSEGERAALRERIKLQMEQRKPSPVVETVEPEDDTLDMFPEENGDEPIEPNSED